MLRRLATARRFRSLRAAPPRLPAAVPILCGLLLLSLGLAWLLWRVLEQGNMDGFKTYDFGGAGRPDQESGLRDFKAKFGGRLVAYGRNMKVHSPNLLRLSEAGYGVYRSLLGYF